MTGVLRNARRNLSGGIAVAVAPLAAALGLEVQMFVWMAPWVIEVEGLLARYLGCTIAMVVFALPAFSVVERLGLLRWWTAALIGFITAIVCDVMLSPLDSNEPMPSTRVMTQFGGSGAVGGVAFWVIWSRGQKKSKT